MYANAIRKPVRKAVRASVSSLMLRLLSRYFRRNEGSTDYATIPTVTLAGDFVIELDFLTSSSAATQVIIGDDHNNTYYVSLISNGVNVWIAGRNLLFNYVSDPRNGVFHAMRISLLGTALSVDIDGVLLGTQSVTPYAGANNFRLYNSNRYYAPFSGILANLKIYDNGTLVRHYPMNDNGNTLIDLAGGQNGTIINGNDDDWGLFDKIADGWLHAEQWPLTPYTYIGNESNGQIVQSESFLTVGGVYRTTITQSGSNTGSTTRALIGNQTLIGAQNDSVSADLLPITTVARWQVVGTPPFVGVVTLSVKEVLKNA